MLEVGGSRFEVGGWRQKRVSVTIKIGRILICLKPKAKRSSNGT